jgi:hypothetical protein
MICHTFFPDISVDKLFYEETEERVTKWKTKRSQRTWKQ